MSKLHSLHGAVLVDLSVAIIAMINSELMCRVVRGSDDLPDRLPFGPFFPPEHRTMESGLRQWVDAQVGVRLAHVEQLYTFGDQGRNVSRGGQSDEEHIVSVGYLALTDTDFIDDERGDWRAVYDFFPWEDWRGGRPRILDAMILPMLTQWARENEQQDRVRIAFGCEGIVWDEERVLDRYEILYEAGLVPEAKVDGHVEQKQPDIAGAALQLDHRRILTTALGRLRGKLKYRPVVFHLMPSHFTLTQLQKTTEAILGATLHKQNFRRLVEKNNFLERTGTSAHARGRPAQLYRFRAEMQANRPLTGLRLNPHRP